MQKVFTEKLWKVMKLCAVQGMIATIICGVCIANDNYGQVLERPVTVSIATLPFEQALGVIEVAANVKFHYSLEQIRDENEVSINAVGQPLRIILDELLLPRKFDYKVNEKSALISIKKQIARDGRSSYESGEAGNNHVATITGTVTESSSGQPMAGVNVLIKGTTVGTTTDAQGQFSIEASETDVLVFSFIGYASQEIQLNDQRSVNVVMTEDPQSLEEVIVNAGYWQVDKREGTGNISRVTSKEIEQQPVANPLQALQGRMPGVVITQNSGITGGSMNIRIRGQNSLRSDGNFPLYVIDGVPVDSRPIESFSSILSRGFDPLNTINPANIESIEILKDADATSIYGSRGANGVVLITTKKGKSGKTDLDINYYQGAGAVTNRLELLNTEQYLMMRQEAFANDNATPGNADPDLNGKWTTDRYTDWQELLFGGTADVQDIQAAVSGGTETTSFRLGGSFHRETTVFQGNFGYKRVTGNMNVNHASRDQRLNISVSLNYGLDQNNLFNRNPVFDALTLPPTAPTYDENGNLIWSGYTINQKNPLSHLRVSHDTETRNFISNATVSYEILKGIRIKSNFGFTDANTDEQIKVPKSSMDPTASVDSQTSFGKRNASTWIIEPQLTYEKECGDHRLDILIGTTWQSNTNEIQWIQATGFLSDGLLGNMNAASSITSSRADDILYKYNALFGRVGYQWKERYIVNLTARRDGSSRFGPNRQFANFGAIGAAWIFSNEPFVANSIGSLSFGKIRASYGTSGSDQIGDYGYIATYATSAFTYQGSKTLVPSALENEDYAWEVNKKFEVAMDLGFFDERIALSSSFYSNRSSNQLVGYQLPVITGFPSVLGNLAATVENSGWEFELKTVNVKSKHFR